MIDTPDNPKIKRMLISGIRKPFRFSSQYKTVLNEARRQLPHKVKKDGNLFKKPNFVYECAMCKNWFRQKDVEVDHIIPVVAFDKLDYLHSLDELANRIFCALGNLQVLCCIPKEYNHGMLSCHKLKSAEEKFIRDRVKELMAITPFNGLTEAILDDIRNEYRKTRTSLEVEKLIRGAKCRF